MFVVEVDFHLTFSFLIVKMEGCRHRFVEVSFSFQVWRYSLMVAMSLLSTPSTACQSPPASMIDTSSAYAYFLEYFLETVVGKLEM